MNLYELHLTLDVVPASLNRELRTHRFVRNKVNKQWDLLIRCACGTQIPDEPLKKAKIQIIRRYFRTLDYDGLVGSMKPVVDALVTAGILKDDSWNTLGAWNVLQEFRPKNEGARLEIKLIQLPLF